MVEKYLREAPNDKVHLPMKVNAILSIHGLTRSVEEASLHFEHFEIKNDVIIVDLNRKKITGKKLNKATCAIVGSEEIAIVKMFVNCFEESNRTGRFLRSLDAKMKGRSDGSSNIGHNTIKK